MPLMIIWRLKDVEVDVNVKHFVSLWPDVTGGSSVYLGHDEVTCETVGVVANIQRGPQGLLHVLHSTVSPTLMQKLAPVVVLVLLPHGPPAV